MTRSGCSSSAPARVLIQWIPLVTALLAPASPAGGQGVHQVASSRAGVIATAHPLATVAGLRMLEAGGNAADAAVAAAFAAAVVLPSMNSIGGRNQILIRYADGRVFGIDGTTQVPRGYDGAAAPRASHGYATVGVPGAVAGLIRLHAEHGNLPLAQAMAPAVTFAREGFRLLPQEEYFQAMASKDLAQSEGGRRYFLKQDGSPFRAGDLLVQRDLARTLESIARDGGESFYRGELAERMARDIQGHGGFVTTEDLAEYRALDARVVTGTYRGHDLVGLGVPAAGAVSIQGLQILEEFEWSSMRPEEWAAVVGQAVGLASRELGRLGTDTAAARATSRAWATRQATLVVRPGGDGAPVRRQERPEGWDPFTTHISVVDEDGGAVSLTQTVGPVLGARVATPGLGFHYASTMGGYLLEVKPGDRARSFISPLMVLKDGAPVLVLGAAGGEKIVSSVVQVVSRVIDEGLSLPEAMAAPRVLMGFDGVLEMETSGPKAWTEDQMARVREMGLAVRPSPGPVAFAVVQALQADPETGVWTAVSEPDGEGMAGGIQSSAPRPPGL